MKLRKCAWLPNEDAVGQRIVWARNGVFSQCCPKSVITAESLRYLEMFALWRQIGGFNLESVEAKTADALIVLQQAWQKENQDGEK